MKTIALRQAQAALEEAREAVARMVRSTSHENTQSGWISYVHAVHRIWKKLQNGANGHRASEVWYSEKRREQKEDAALQYVHQSRNADNYGLYEGTHEADMPFYYIAQQEWQGMEVTVHPRTTYLRPVNVRGKTYFPPRGLDEIDIMRTGIDDNWRKPTSLGQLLMFYFDNLLEEASNLQKHV